MRAFALAIVLTLLSVSPAAAFTTAPGFSASVYASGVTPATSIAGAAFIGTTLYAVDPADSGLYRADLGVTPIAYVRIQTIGGEPTGVAALGGALYITRAGAQDVVRVIPGISGMTMIAPASAIPCPNALAADPVTGDLFVTTCESIYRISTPAVSPVISKYLDLFPGGTNTYGITIDASGTLYVAAPAMGQIWRVPGPASVGVVKGPVGYVTGARGVALVASSYLYVSAANGSITKIPLPELGGSNVSALTGGDPGDLATLGPDGCFYASQGAATIRLGDATGGCDLLQAAPPPPPPSIVLTNVSGIPPLVGGGDQQISATLMNAPISGNVNVTFTVTGANPQTRTVPTSPNGVAMFAYSATNVGTDTITATAVVNGTTVTSNAITVVWPRRFDTAAPTITYTVTGTAGPSFGCPRPDIGQLGVTEYCGWFVTSPTITWTVTPNGPSGIGSQTNCPPFTLVGSSPITGTPVTCIAYNGDGVSTALQVRLQAVATPPSIVPSAVSDGAPYIPGTRTASAVTVTFACDSAFGAAGITSCTAPITYSTTGTFTATGIVTDVTGTTRTVTFGPIVIDRDGPSIAATATAGGLPYTFGTPTSSNVTLTFTCADPAGVPHCPDPIVVSAAGTASVTVSAADALGNISSATFGPIVIDRTGPTVTATVTPTPDGAGNVPLSGTVSLHATDSSGVASITYSTSGALVTPLTTVLSANAAVTISAIGTTTVTYYATDALGNVSATGHTDVHVISTQPSSLRIVSGTNLAEGAVTVRAQLVGMDGVSPAVGRTVTFSAGGVTATGTTDAQGYATATLPLGTGQYTLAASFAGDTAYFASNAQHQSITVYVLTRFVVWSPNANIGATVQFYGGDWSKQISDKDVRKGFSDFKGYAENVYPTYWNARSGDALKPPKTIPQYIGVILTNSASKTKDVITGDNAGIAIVKVTGGDEDPDKGKKDKPYDGKLGDRGFGTVLAVIRR